jgi:hypothetical protein
LRIWRIGEAEGVNSHWPAQVVPVLEAELLSLGERLRYSSHLQRERRIQDFQVLLTSLCGPVKVMQRYSKLPELMDLSAISNGRDVDGRRPRVHRVSKRLGEDAMRAMVTDYTENRMSCADFARKYGIAKSTVIQALHDRGVSMRPSGRTRLWD